MAVYVNEIFTWPVSATRDGQAKRLAKKTGGRWCHIWADTEKELVDFAVRIGLHSNWIQKPGTPHVHFDLTPSKRRAALNAGAIESTDAEWVKKKPRISL